MSYNLDGSAKRTKEKDHNDDDSSDPDLNDIMNESDNDDDDDSSSNSSPADSNKDQDGGSDLSSRSDQDKNEVDSDSGNPLDKVLDQQDNDQTRSDQKQIGRRVAIKAGGGDTQEEMKTEDKNNIYFEDIVQTEKPATITQNNNSAVLTDSQAQERKSFREKLRASGAVKSFMSNALDKGLKAMQNLKDNVANLDSSNLLFTGQEKKAAQKRLSEDFTLQGDSNSAKNISAAKNVQLIKSENQDSKQGSDADNDDEDQEISVNKQQKQLEDDLKKKINFDEKKKTKKDKSSSDDSDSEELNEDDILNEDDDDEDDDDDGEEEDSEISENEQKKILADLDKEDDDDDDDDDEDDDDNSNSDSVGELSNVKDGLNTSLLTDDIANRSLNAEDEDSLVVIDSQNYLKYVSEKHNIQNDVLEVIDKNERSFKQVAERIINQTSYLVQPLNEVGITLSQQIEDGNTSISVQSAKRLMLTSTLKSITQRYHGDLKAQQGVPYSIAAQEQFIAVGSSDGSVRIFDNHERELKVLADKSLKGVPVQCLDMQRSRSNNLFVATGHSKGQITLHEIKGLRPYQDAVLSQVSSKHHKTINDIHTASVVSIKFVGELGPYLQSLTTISCDLEGVVYICLFKEGLMSYSCNKQCFMKKRVGPTFSIAPLLQYSQQTLDETISEQLQLQIKNGGSNTEVDFTRKRPQLVAFGSLERIIIAQIRPAPKELLFIDRPDYLELGTVPYLDWGLALSPCFRDKSYPVLAIAWGKVLQLSVYVNFDQQQGAVQEPPLIQYDGYYVCEHSIDACYFLGESIIFVIVNKQDVRILYTQNFTPGIFDETYQLNDPNRTKSATELLDPMKRAKYFMRLKESFAANISSQYAEKDKNYKLLQEGIRFRDLDTKPPQSKSKFNSNPSICKNYDNMIYALGKTSIGQGKLLQWEEYLDLVRRAYPNDWLKVLRASLDIYNGKMVGLAGLPDLKETREHMLRESMKQLLRQNIDACIREFQEGECVSNKTLRVAVEFCIRVNAIDHLFGELFQMFAEAGMEQKFFENLEPFILSGKFKQFKIPEEILVRLIGYQRQKDLELLEKTLLNIDLGKYSCLLEVRHICETELLTSALIHILINEFDDDRESTVCLQLLCSLYNMKKKSKNQKVPKSEIFKLLNYEPLDFENQKTIFEEELKSQDRSSFSTTSSQQFQAPVQNNNQSASNTINKWQKLEIEQSSTYIGYKLMWVIKLFLEGKKFPQGTLSAFKWRIYVYDIVRFATNEEFLNWSLEFDPDTFFKLMKALFVEQEPYEYIQSQTAFIAMYKDQINGLDECMTHKQIVETLYHAVQNYISKDRDFNNGYLSTKGECALNSFIFFVAQINRRPQVEIPEQLCIYAIREQIKFSKKLLKIPNLLSEEITKLQTQPSQGKQLQHQQSSNNQNMGKQDKMTRVYTMLVKKNEKDVLSLINRCENEMDEEELLSLAKDAERSPMYKVKVLIQQLMRNYELCLHMFFKIPAIREEVFSWLQEISKHVRKGASNNNNQNSGLNIEAQLRILIESSIAQFVEMDSVSTVKLTESWLDRDFMGIVDKLGNNNDLVFKFLSTLLSMKEAEMEQEYNQLMITGGRLNSPIYNQYKRLILRFVQVLTEKKYRVKLVEYVKKKYYPIDESLEIIRVAVQAENTPHSNKKAKKLKEDTQEAQAILLKRKGEYIESVDLFINVLIDLSIIEITSALYLDANIKFNSTTTTDPHIQRYDQIVSQVMNICEKYGSRLPEQEQEELWMHSIKSIYRIKQVVFERMKNDLSAKDQDKYSTFQMIRIQEFMRRMSEHLRLNRILEFLEEIGHPIKYQEFRQTFEDKVRTELHHENILANARQLIVKDLLTDGQNLKKLCAKGVYIQKQKCDYCKRDILYKWDIQDVCLFKCGHIFHHRCVSNTDFKCFLCFNEFDQIQMIINQRGVRRVGKKSKDMSGSTDDGDHKSQKKRRDSVKDKNGSVHHHQHKNSKEQETSPKKINQKEFEKIYKSDQFLELTRIMNRFDSELNEKIIHLQDF